MTTKWNEAGSWRLGTLFKDVGTGAGMPAPHKESHRCQHPAPAQECYDTGDRGVMLQDAEAGEDRVPVMLDAIAAARAHPRQPHCTRIGHIDRRVEPVLKEEKQAES